MKFRFDVLKSILILSFICLLVASALAVVNHFTYPKIKSDMAERAYRARIKIIPEADGFALMDIENLRANGLPATITEIYKATNDTGYIFTISVKGFGRENMRLLSGVDMDGKIIQSTRDDLVLSHSETPSYFNRVFTDFYLNRFWRNDKDGIEEIDAISGATITSNALKAAMRDALAAFELIRSQP